MYYFNFLWWKYILNWSGNFRIKLKIAILLRISSFTWWTSLSARNHPFFIFKKNKSNCLHYLGCLTLVKHPHLFSLCVSQSCWLNDVGAWLGIGKSSSAHWSKVLNEWGKHFIYHKVASINTSQLETQAVDFFLIKHI